jgi:hypothetical protein
LLLQLVAVRLISLIFMKQPGTMLLTCRGVAKVEIDDGFVNRWAIAHSENRP